MFSSYNNLKRKTPNQGIDRQEFIQHLVDEYYTSTDVGKLPINVKMSSAAKITNKLLRSAGAGNS